MIHDEPFRSKQSRDRAIAVSSILLSQLNHALDQTRLIIRHVCLATLRAPRLIQHLTSSTFGHLAPTQRIARVLDGAATLGRAQ